MALRGVGPASCPGACRLSAAASRLTSIFTHSVTSIQLPSRLLSNLISPTSPMNNIIRQFGRLSRSLHTEAYATSSANLPVPVLIATRDAHTMGDPSSSGSSISMAPHPKDPGPSTQAGSSRPPPPPPPIIQAGRGDEHDIPHEGDNLPVPVPTYMQPAYTPPPFHTHAFYAALEKTFPPSTARHLMRATRALLVDRIGRVRREAVTHKDLDNVRDLAPHVASLSSLPLPCSKRTSSAPPSPSFVLRSR